MTTYSLIFVILTSHSTSHHHKPYIKPSSFEHEYHKKQIISSHIANNAIISIQPAAPPKPMLFLSLQSEAPSTASHQQQSLHDLSSSLNYKTFISTTNALHHKATRLHP